jgi:hypothetical protein
MYITSSCTAHATPRYGAVTRPLGSMCLMPDEARHAHEPIATGDADVDYLRKNLIALQRVLQAKGVLTYGEVLKEIHTLDAIDHASGQRVIARAWSDPDYKGRLMKDGKAALTELGIQPGGYRELQVVENTPAVHHVVVCTTCSCIPAPLTGTTPDWYKSAAYRTRVIQEPRVVLHEFGLDLPDEVEVRVVDTDVHRRCLVIPLKPAGAAGLTEDQLAQLVTRDSLFGTGVAAGPVGG